MFKPLDDDLLITPSSASGKLEFHGFHLVSVCFCRLITPLVIYPQANQSDYVICGVKLPNSENFQGKFHHRQGACLLICLLVCSSQRDGSIQREQFNSYCSNWRGTSRIFYNYLWIFWLLFIFNIINYFYKIIILFKTYILLYYTTF